MDENIELTILEDRCELIATEQNTNKCLITLDHKNLTIRFDGVDGKVKKISDSDIIGCHVFESYLDMVLEKRISCVPSRVRPKTPIEDQGDVACYLDIFAYPLKYRLKGFSRNRSRERLNLKLKLGNLETKEANYERAKQWQTTISWVRRGVSKIPPSPPTPRRLLFFVNPCSGSGKALNIFKEQVIPLLKESETVYELLITARANYARDYVKTNDLSVWDGFVVVSGDGLVYEILNGIMERPDWESTIKVPMGVIPGGSGNGLAMAVSYSAREPYDGSLVVPATLNVVRGRVSPIDLVRVETPTGCLYSLLSIGWGIIADIDIESERLRAIGGARFAVWSLIRAIGLRNYPGRVSYLPVAGYVQPPPKKSFFYRPKLARSQTMCPENASKESKSFGRFLSRPEFSNSIGNHSRKPSEVVEVAFEASQVLECYDEEMKEDENANPHHSLGFAGQPDSPKSVIRRRKSDLDQPDAGEMENIDLRFEPITPVDTPLEPLSESKENSKIPPFDCPVPSDWVTVEGDFVSVYISHVTHLSADCLFAPEAKLDDGLMWLVMIRAGVSRAQVIQFLLAMEDGSHVNIPYVELVPITAFRLEPFTKDGYLTIDGEAIECSSIQAEVLPSVARIMTR